MMRRNPGYLIMILMVLFAAVSLAAQEKKGDQKTVMPGDLVEQTLCPVMGGEIDREVYTDYQGQRVYFCCAWCIDKFKEDPEAVFEKTAEGMILYENVQTSCPVSGDPIDREYFRYYKGRGLYFCGEDCATSFDAEPAKYLEKMEKKAAGDQGEE